MKDVFEDGVEVTPKRVGLSNLNITVFKCIEIGVFELYLTMMRGVNNFEVIGALLCLIVKCRCI